MTETFQHYCTHCKKKRQHIFKIDKDGALAQCLNCDEINKVFDNSELRLPHVEEYFEKEVVKHGNGAMVGVPKKYIGRKVVVSVIIEDPRKKMLEKFNKLPKSKQQQILKSIEQY